VSSLKLIKVPSHNSAKNQRFFLSRLAGSRALPSEDITGLKQKILAGFSQIFSFQEKTLEVTSFRSSPTGCLSPMLKCNSRARIFSSSREDILKKTHTTKTSSPKCQMVVPYLKDRFVITKTLSFFKNSPSSY